MIVSETLRARLLGASRLATLVGGASLLMWAGCAQAAGQATQVAATEAPKADATQVEEIIVTGVLRDTIASKAPIASTTVSEQRIRDLVPISAADILSEIPGVVVTTDAGETRNTVYARGLSFGTSAGSFGYYWTTMMEDGLPVIGGLFSNFQPDMFLRTDLTLKRVQSVRGGSAAVTGPNAPGGLFNYISKTGITDPGGMIGTRIGYEGPSGLYQKHDFYYGARNDERTFGWSVGGNYRRSYGYRDIPYPLNDGGQIKANLNTSYHSPWGDGGLLFTVKYLNDHNGNLDNYRPLAHGFKALAFDTPFGRSANFLPAGDIDHEVCYADTSDCNTWQAGDFSHYKTYAASVKWDHDFGGGWRFSNNIKWQRNQAEHTYAESISYLSVTNATTYTNLGTSLAGLSTTPGYFTISDRGTGAVLARVNQRTAASTATGVACSALCIQTTTPNLLPNQQIEANSPISSNNLILTVGALNGVLRSDDLIDLATMTKTFDKVTITAGAYMSSILFTRRMVYGGRGVMGLQNSPDTYDIDFTTTSASTAGGAAGTTYQLTDASGFGGIGSSSGLSLYDTTRTYEVSPLLGVTYEPNESWLFDFGARYTYYGFKGLNHRYATNTNAASRTFGGRDGNPLTLYDNLYAVDTPATTINYKKDIKYLQYTGAVAYVINPNNSMYFRYTKGRKNADGVWNGYDAQYKVDLSDPGLLPVIKQYELQYTFRTKRFTFIPTLYYTDLTQVAVVRNDGLLSDNTTRYTTPPAYSHFKSYGLELDSGFRFNKFFDVRNVLTLNDAKSISVASWNLGTCNGSGTACNGADPRADDFAVYSSGPQERAAKVSYNGTFNAHYGKLHGYYRFRYTGKRPTTVAATAYLPPNKVSDMGIRYDFSRDLSVNFNVNNLLNDKNATQIGQVGNLPSGVTQDQFIDLYPNALVNVQTNAPRSYFISATARF